MMYPWLDYKGLAYYSKKLRDKLKSAFSDIYDDIADITDEEIEALFEDDGADTTSNNSMTQNSLENNEDNILKEEEILERGSNENENSESDVSSEDPSLIER